MYFLHPLFLVCVPFIIALAIYARRRNMSSGIAFSSGKLFEEIIPSFRVYAARYLYVCRICALVLIACACARPQAPLGVAYVETEGVHIVLAVDSSTSMLAEDFKIAGRRVNRVDIVKDVVKEFIKGRRDDRIGLVTFGARAYTMCPLTLDYGWLTAQVDRIHAGMVEDGTAVGEGIAASLNRLRSSRVKSKIVILLTDGRNNAGKISPVVAAQAAAALRIKVYTIGAGSQGAVPYPVRDVFGRQGYQQVEVDLDEATLKTIADTTGARYFRATDTESLRKIYAEINRMEKSPIQEQGYREVKELYGLFLIPGILLLILELLLNNTVLRKLP